MLMHHFPFRFLSRTTRVLLGILVAPCDTSFKTSRHRLRGIRCFQTTTAKASPPERACQSLSKLLKDVYLCCSCVSSWWNSCDTSEWVLVLSGSSFSSDSYGYERDHSEEDSPRKKMKSKFVSPLKKIVNPKSERYMSKRRKAHVLSGSGCEAASGSGASNGSEFGSGNRFEPASGSGPANLSGTGPAAAGVQFGPNVECRLER
ncbi:hypothetical protein PIB30_105969 [Stylosanthes scabra]|uniref:Uncharacterized protein n=1 Tax=Stylosanthes scabra TaxID=79078 RepID=A0ABU6Z1N4_9FABA|nr:hypothetical protein [Stylosanthes scabra]